jgi:hypothetical protein
VSDDYRAQHPWLEHQDAIGFGIFSTSCLAILGLGFGYATGRLSAWWVMPLTAFFMSLLHELEHDLIHRLYFKHHPWLYNAMLAGVWIFRPSTINPWVRRDLHLHHHRLSGTESDLEERAITNGEPWGIRRLLMTADSMLAIVLRVPTVHRMLRAYVDAQKPASRRERLKLLWRNRLSYVPLGTVYYALWHFWLLAHAAEWVGPRLGYAVALPVWWTQPLALADVAMVTWVLPNALRSFCLHFVSSNMHYYGDIEPRNTLQQTQVWTAWWTFPVQMFCFNFGATHAIHHFVVQEPFYLRQLVASRCYPLMRAHGVRFNDFGTFLRANRWTRVESEAPARHGEAEPQGTPAVAGANGP